MRASSATQVLMTCILLLATTHVTRQTAASKNQTLYVLTLLPFPYYQDQQFNPSWSEGPQVSLALELAKEQINNQTAILPDYNIELIYGDSGCEYVDRAYEAVGSSAYYPGTSVINPVGIIGPGCSSSSLEVSSLSGRDELSLVTIHGGGSPLLSNRTNFPNSLGSLGSADAFSNLAIKLMKTHDWQRIGILYFEVRQFFYTTATSLNDIIRNLNDTSLTVDFYSPVYDETYIPLDDILGLGLRINILFTPRGTTQRILCLAMSRKMIYPDYQWIITSNTFEEIAVDVSFDFEGRSYSCSSDEMKMKALNRALFFNYQLSHINQSQSSTFSLFTFQEYDNLIRNELDEHNKQNNVNLTYSVWTSYFYDSLWAWSVVLDRVTKRVPGPELTRYRYGNSSITNMFLEEFYRLDFEGVSGKIKFDNRTGFLPRIISIFQVIDGVAFEAAYFDGVGFNNATDNFTLEAIPGDFPDRDHAIEVWVCIILLIPVVIEFVLVMVLHILTLKYRMHQSVKASSPKLSQLGFIGLYFFLFTMFLYVLRFFLLLDDLSTQVLCNMTWGWLLPISFTLTFGTVAARTWRLYRIFTHYLNPGRFIADHYLMAFVFILLGVDVLLGTLWGAIDPQKVRETELRTTEGVETFKVAVKMCSSDNPFWSLGLIFGFRVIIIVTVLVLTFLTRKIKNQSFRTKTLRVLVYLSSVVMVIGFLIYYLFLFNADPRSHVSFYILITVFNIVVLLYMFLISFPPLIPVLREKFYQKFPHLQKTQEFVFEVEDDESIPMEGSSRFYI